MRIENMNTKEEWNQVVIHLARSEAAELRDALETLLSSGDGARHEHIPSSDFQKEITVVLSERET
jgi:hypothetical protein